MSSFQSQLRSLQKTGPQRVQEVGSKISKEVADDFNRLAEFGKRISREVSEDAAYLKTRASIRASARRSFLGLSYRGDVPPPPPPLETTNPLYSHRDTVTSTDTIENSQGSTSRKGTNLASTKFLDDDDDNESKSGSSWLKNRTKQAFSWRKSITKENVKEDKQNLHPHIVELLITATLPKLDENFERYRMREFLFHAKPAPAIISSSSSSAMKQNGESGKLEKNTSTSSSSSRPVPGKLDLSNLGAFSNNNKLPSTSPISKQTTNNNNNKPSQNKTIEAATNNQKNSTPTNSSQSNKSNNSPHNSDEKVKNTIKQAAPLANSKVSSGKRLNPTFEKFRQREFLHPYVPQKKPEQQQTKKTEEVKKQEEVKNKQVVVTSQKDKPSSVTPEVIPTNVIVTTRAQGNSASTTKQPSPQEKPRVNQTNPPTSKPQQTQLKSNLNEESLTSLLTTPPSPVSYSLLSSSLMEEEKGKSVVFFPPTSPVIETDRKVELNPQFEEIRLREFRRCQEQYNQQRQLYEQQQRQLYEQQQKLQLEQRQNNETNVLDVNNFTPKPVPNEPVPERNKRDSIVFRAFRALAGGVTTSLSLPTSPVKNMLDYQGNPGIFQGNAPPPEFPFSDFELLKLDGQRLENTFQFNPSYQYNPLETVFETRSEYTSSTASIAARNFDQEHHNTLRLEKQPIF